MASKTVKQLIMVGNREYPCKRLSGAQSRHSGANRLMSTKKSHGLFLYLGFIEIITFMNVVWGLSNCW